MGGSSGEYRKILQISNYNLKYGLSTAGGAIILMNYIDRDVVRELSTSSSAAEPFLKWAGGKRWLFRRYRHLFPRNIERLIDPFVGGGSSFFYLQPHTAILSDLNSDLIDLYAAVRTHPRMLTKRLVHYHYAHSESFFYKIRASKPSDPLKKAAWLLYLNRTCWNGLFRVNLRGEFNVPIGTKKKVFVSIADDNTSVAISYLSGFSKYDGRDSMAPLQVDTCCLSGIKIADSSQAL